MLFVFFPSPSSKFLLFQRIILQLWLSGPLMGVYSVARIFRKKFQSAARKGAPAQESRTGTRLVSPAAGWPQAAKKKKDTFGT